MSENNNILHDEPATTSRKESVSRLFVATMLVLAVPIIGWTVHVVGHRYDINSGADMVEWKINRDNSIVLRSTQVGRFFGKIRVQLDAFDLKEHTHLWTWHLDKNAEDGLAVSDDGTMIAIASTEECWIHEFDPPHNRILKITSPKVAVSRTEFRWIENDTKVLFGVRPNGFLVKDLDDGRVESVSGGEEPYPFIGYWISDDWYLTVHEKFGVPQKVYRRDGTDLVAVPELIPNSENRGWVFHGGTRMHFYEAKYMTNLETNERIALQPPDSKGYYQARFSDELVYYHDDGTGYTKGASLIDPNTGAVSKSIAFDDSYVGDIWFCYKHGQFFGMTYEGRLFAIDQAGKKTWDWPSPKRALARSASAAIAFVLLWWVIWVWRMRRSVRSWQPAIAIAILHGVVLSISTLRLFSGSYHRAPEQLESAFFLAATTSTIALFSFWFVFGTVDWRRRCTQGVGLITATAALYLVLWSGQDKWAMAGTLPSFAITTLVFCALLFRLRVRLTHQSDKESVRPWKDRTVGIKQAIIWIMAFAILFGVARLAPKPQASSQLVMVAIAQGIAAALVALVCVCSMLWIRGRVIGVLVTALFLITVCGGLNQAYGAPPVWNGGQLIHIGGSFLFVFAVQTVLLSLSVWSLKKNGYRLARIDSPG